MSSSARSERDETTARIHATVDAIARGRVATYGQVAAEAGLVRRARLVGRVLRDLPPGSALPWHRVVRADGSIAPRGDGASERLQARLLAAEGVALDARGRVDLGRYRWTPATEP